MAAIDTYGVTSATAKAFRALNKYGMHLADFAALTTNSSFTGFGNGTGYTVSQWISDGVFANLAAVQAVYPIVRSTSDRVDWVLLQSACDFLIYGALGTSNRQNMKRKLLIPAGHFIITGHTLHLGYGSVGTPPVNLNGNGYISITIEGEGRQIDTSGNGMTGTTIFSEDYTRPGICIQGYQAVQLKGFTIRGPAVGYLENNNPIRDSDNYDRTAYRQVSPAVANANWFGGAAVNIGIGMDLYSTAGSAAAYPARVLPSYFGGGTSTAQGGNGGTTVEIEDVSVQGFVIGIGRPHGDGNGEFFRIHNSDIRTCCNGLVIGHSQARNVSVTNTNFEIMHTAITSRGGLTGNSNMHGTYQGLHFGNCYQLIDHPAADWSGPLTLRDCYAELFWRIGTFNGQNCQMDNCYLSFLEQENGFGGFSATHFTGGALLLHNTTVRGVSHGLIVDAGANSGTRVELSGSSGILYGFGSTLYNGTTTEQIAIAAGQRYMQGLYQYPGSARRRVLSGLEAGIDGRGNLVNQYSVPDDLKRSDTFLDQYFTTFYAQYPEGDYPNPAGSPEMQGSVQWFPVPKITKRQININVASRTGANIVIDRYSAGDLKADIGDVYAIESQGVDASLKVWTWFTVVSATSTTLTLRQMHNYYRTNQYEYIANANYQISAGSYDTTLYINTRVKQNPRLFVGDVTSGSAVISNIRHAFQFGTTDQFNSSNFDMAVGDYFLHQEIERSLSTGGVKVHNRVSAIDYTANTITLTENFNITRVAYPIVFYVKTYTA